MNSEGRPFTAKHRGNIWSPLFNLSHHSFCYVKCVYIFRKLAVKESHKYLLCFALYQARLVGKLAQKEQLEERDVCLSVCLSIESMLFAQVVLTITQKGGKKGT